MSSQLVTYTEKWETLVVEVEAPLQVVELGWRVSDALQSEEFFPKHAISTRVTERHIRRLAR